MQDVIDTFAGAADILRIAQIALNELHAIENFSEVLPEACFKIVEAANCFSALYKRLADPGAKESGAAGYEITSHVSTMLAAAAEAA